MNSEDSLSEECHNSEPPSDPILMGFRADRGVPEMLGPEWGYGWRVQSAVLSKVMEPDLAVWTSKLRDKLRPENVGVVRPLRSSDGRYVLGGWRADAWVPGHPAPRFDEVAAASLRVSKALAEELPQSVGAASAPFPQQEVSADTLPWSSADLFHAADVAAFSENAADVIAPGLDTSAVASVTVARSLDLAARVAGLRGEITAPDQVVHADMLGTTIFDGSSPPVITDLVPAFHPASWPVALVIVDGIAWGNADDGLLRRWSHLPDFGELVIRALLYRLFIHALHPMAREGAIDGLDRVAELVRSLR